MQYRACYDCNLIFEVEGEASCPECGRALVVYAPQQTASAHERTQLVSGPDAAALASVPDPEARGRRGADAHTVERSVPRSAPDLKAVSPSAFGETPGSGGRRSDYGRRDPYGDRRAAPDYRAARAAPEADRNLPLGRAVQFSSDDADDGTREKRRPITAVERLGRSESPGRAPPPDRRNRSTQEVQVRGSS
ncbi:MAG: hypothetical protein KC620_22290, partial [Myxococcales bacterium]|nr:hypothetical protein [Myxococcales bacterium]